MTFSTPQFLYSIENCKNEIDKRGIFAFNSITHTHSLNHKQNYNDKGRKIWPQINYWDRNENQLDVILIAIENAFQFSDINPYIPANDNGNTISNVSLIKSGQINKNEINVLLPCWIWGTEVVIHIWFLLAWIFFIGILRFDINIRLKVVLNRI